MYTSIKGVTFDNRQKLIKRYAKDGVSIYIKDEPENKYDKNAKAFYIQRGFFIFKKLHKLGYIDTVLANEGLCFKKEAKIHKVIGVKEVYAVNIELTILEEGDEGYIA